MKRYLRFKKTHLYEKDSKRNERNKKEKKNDS